MEYGHVTSLLNRFLIKYCAVKFIVTERRKDQREIGYISNICQYFSSIGFRFYKKRLIKYIWEITLCKEVTHIYHSLSDDCKPWYVSFSAKIINKLLNLVRTETYFMHCCILSISLNIWSVIGNPYVSWHN